MLTLLVIGTDGLPRLQNGIRGLLPRGSVREYSCLPDHQASCRAASAGPTPTAMYFDDTAADRVCQFIYCLKHFKGEWLGRPFHLLPYQVFIARLLFGWKQSKDHLRRYRTALIVTPRKSGKSTFLAASAFTCSSATARRLPKSTVRYEEGAGCHHLEGGCEDGTAERIPQVETDLLSQQPLRRRDFQQVRATQRPTRRALTVLI